MRALLSFLGLAALAGCGEANPVGLDATGGPDASVVERPCEGRARVPLFVVIVRWGDPPGGPASVGQAASYAATIVDHGLGLCVAARMAGPMSEPGPSVNAVVPGSLDLLRRDWETELEQETSCGVDGEIPECRTELVVRILGQDYELPSRDHPGPTGDAYRFLRSSFEMGVPIRERDARLLASGDWPLP